MSEDPEPDDMFSCIGGIAIIAIVVIAAVIVAAAIAVIVASL